MRIHLPSLPHTQTTKEYAFCAYTQKVLKFASMMTDIGHEVILYGGTENDARCTEFVTVVTEEDHARWFPDYDMSQAWNGFDVNAPHWQGMNNNVAEEIRIRQQPGDLLCVIAGWCQQPLAEQFPEMLPIEYGIGYEGVFADFRVFESYAWMHYLADREISDDLRWYDTVIPNYFDPDDYDFRPACSNAHGSYLLYMGRMTPRKGLPVITEIAARSNIEIFSAGQDVTRIPGVKHLGVVTGKEKSQLLGGAKAVLVPTTYLEPFGGVSVEAMLCGTPVITTDYGAFTETVKHGETGYRCHTLPEFMCAIDELGHIDRTVVRKHAEQYLMPNVAPRYEEYFYRVMSLRHTNWDGTPVGAAGADHQLPPQLHPARSA